MVLPPTLVYVMHYDYEHNEMYIGFPFSPFFTFKNASQKNLQGYLASRLIL